MSSKVFNQLIQLLAAVCLRLKLLYLSIFVVSADLCKQKLSQHANLLYHTGPTPSIHTRSRSQHSIFLQKREKTNKLLYFTRSLYYNSSAVIRLLKLIDKLQSTIV